MDEGKKLEFPSREKNVEVTDSVTRTFTVRDTKQITLKGVSEDLWLRYRDYARKYCKGNWTLALQKMLDVAELTPIINKLVDQVDDLGARVGALENPKPTTEEDERKTPKTFGGSG